MGLERGQRAFSQEATGGAGGVGETQKDDTHTVSQDLAHNKCQKIRQLSFTQQTLANTISVLFTVPRAEAGRVLKMLPPGGAQAGA